MMNTQTAEQALKAIQAAMDVASLVSPREVTGPLHDAMIAAKRHLDECRRYNRQYDPRTLPQS